MILTLPPRRGAWVRIRDRRNGWIKTTKKTGNCLIPKLNRALCGKFEEHFVTAAYLFVDLEKSLLRYSAAAHPPLMLASGAASNIREIEENGLTLGMFPEAVYSPVEIRVGPGDRCLLLSPFFTTMGTTPRAAILRTLALTVGKLRALRLTYSAGHAGESFILQASKMDATVTALEGFLGGTAHGRFGRSN